MCRVTEDLENQEFLGLHRVTSTDAITLTTVITNVFTRLNLSLEKLQGQCYDGASATSGRKRGIAKQISDLEPRTLYLHCYGHALNLAINYNEGCIRDNPRNYKANKILSMQGRNILKDEGKFTSYLHSRHQNLCPTR